MIRCADANLFRPYHLADIADPDLVVRIRKGWQLAEATHDQSYGEGRGAYTDFPSYDGAESRKAGR